MKEVRLLELELTNYRNIEHEVYVFNGDNSKIVGENRIGKTNTLEAIYFLLTNYLLDGSSDLSAIKPIGDTKKEVKVEGTFRIKQENGLTHTIRLAKIYGEKWVKTRGLDETTMQGHYEKYLINGIEQPREKAYYDNLQEFFGVRNDEKGEVDIIQMLINPLYLGNLGESKDWTRLRTYIVKLIGDVEDKEIFEKEPTTQKLEQDLLNALGKTEQLKKMYKDKVDTLKTQITGFDSQIELLEKTPKPSDEEVEKAKSEIEEIENKVLEIKASSGKDSVVEQLESEIFALSKQIVAKNQVEFNAYLESQKTSEKSEHDSKVKELHSQINGLVEKLTAIKIKQGQSESELRTLHDRKNTLAHEYKDYEARINNVDNDIVKECPTCHRPFEESELATRKEELLKDLIAFKDKVVNEGKEVVNKIKEKEQIIKDYEKQVDGIRDEIETLKHEINELEKMSFEKPAFEESKELVELREKERELKDQLSNRKAKVSEQASNEYELLTSLENDKMNAQKVIDDRNYYDRQMTLLESVKLEEKSVSKELTQVEQKQEALKLYIYTKLRVLDEHIAKVFGKIKFQLIKENINGGFDPVCKPYVYDVDKDESTNTLWKSASKSEKIITGIAIVEAIRKELDLSELPILFDEGGEISKDTLATKFKTNAQIICVRVEDNIMKPIVVKF
jgi:myosin heavy subunit